MSIVVEFKLPSSAFPFGRATSGDPNARVQLERVIPLKEGRIPFLLATGEKFDDFERHLNDSEIVKHAEAVTRVGDNGPLPGAKNREAIATTRPLYCGHAKASN